MYVSLHLQDVLDCIPCQPVGLPGVRSAGLDSAGSVSSHVLAADVCMLLCRRVADKLALA